MIDIGRLHDVVEGRRYGRGSGRTTAACCNIAGVLGVAEKDTVILFVLPNRNWQRHVLAILFDVLRDQGFGDVRFVSTQDEVRVGGHRVRFVYPHDPWQLRGTHADFVAEDLGEAEEYIGPSDFERLALEVNMAMR